LSLLNVADAELNYLLTYLLHTTQSYLRS